MNAHHPGRLDRHAAEQLLRGERGPGVHGALSDLLDAAAAQPRDGDPPGEQAALAAFRAARREPTPQSSRSPGRTRLLGRNLPIKLAVAVAAALAVGGTAAAVTGTLPTGLTGSVPSSTAPAMSPSAHPDQPPARDHGAPSVQDLCQRYAANPGGDHSRTLDNPAFGPLVHAAGGKGNVSAYCARLPGASQPAPKPGAGNGSPHPGGHNDQPGPPG